MKGLPLARSVYLGVKVALLVAKGNAVAAEDSCLDMTQEVSEVSASTTSAFESPSKQPALKVCLMVEPSPFTYVSGYANRFQEMLQFLDTAGDEVEVVTVDVNTQSPPTSWQDVPIHHTWGITVPRYQNVSVSIDWKFRALRMLWRMCPDILHVSSPGLMVFPAIFYSRLLSIPLVMSYHTNLPLYIKNYFVRAGWLQHVAWWLIRFVHSFADLTLVTSPQVKVELQQHGVRRVDVWLKGIDTNKFHPNFQNQEMRYKMTEGHVQDFLILYVGRLGTEKRVLDLLPIMKQSPDNTRLCIVGAGPQEDELRRTFETTNTLFMGELHRQELSRAFASTDVLILPSDTETLGFVVLESMASGVPVIGANAGGIPHLIENGVTSFLVSPGNTSEYLERIRQVRNDKEFRMIMGKVAREEAEKWSWESSMGHLRNVQYKQAQENFQHRWFCWNRRRKKRSETKTHGE